MPKRLLAVALQPAAMVIAKTVSGRQAESTASKTGRSELNRQLLVMIENMQSRPGAVGRERLLPGKVSWTHIQGSPPMNTRHCLKSIGCGLKCHVQETPPQEQARSKPCRWYTGLGSEAPATNRRRYVTPVARRERRIAQKLRGGRAACSNLQQPSSMIV